MKIERQGDRKCPTCGGPGFQPVVIELETQDEVDQVFALLNYYAQFSCIKVGSLLYNDLQKIRSKGYEKWHYKLLNHRRGE